VWVWELARTENMKIYSNADAVQNWRKYIYDGVANPLEDG